MTHDLLLIKPSEIPRPTKHGKTYFTKGDFLYFHYSCDNYDDVVSSKYCLTNSSRFLNLVVDEYFAFFQLQIYIGMGLCISNIAVYVFMDRKKSPQHNGH